MPLLLGDRGVHGALRAGARDRRAGGTGGGAVDGADAAPPAGDRYGRRLARLEAARGGHAGSCRSSSGSFPRARRRFRRFEAAGHAHRGARSGQSGHPAAHGSHSVGAPRRPAPGRPRRRAPSTPGPLLPTPGRRRRATLGPCCWWRVEPLLRLEINHGFSCGPSVPNLPRHFQPARRGTVLVRGQGPESRPCRYAPLVAAGCELRVRSA